MTNDILASMTPTTLVRMHEDALDAEFPDLCDDIRAHLVALVGEDEADILLYGTPDPLEAAAPDMPEALRALDHINQIASFRPYADDSISRIRDIARAAIAKATA